MPGKQRQQKLDKHSGAAEAMKMASKRGAARRIVAAPSGERVELAGSAAPLSCPDIVKTMSFDAVSQGD